MELDKVIKLRRSVRQFADKEVKMKDILACIEAARLAPSACNSQPTHFVILNDKKIKEDFANTVFAGRFLPCKFFKNAPVLVVVCVEQNANLTVKTGQKIVGRPFYITDQAIATEHFVLKATDLGLGTCWVGWFSSQKAQEFLKTPKGVEIHNLIALGYPKNTPKQIKHTRKKIEEIYSLNTYK